MVLRDSGQHRMRRQAIRQDTNTGVHAFAIERGRARHVLERAGTDIASSKSRDAATHIRASGLGLRTSPCQHFFSRAPPKVSPPFLGSLPVMGVDPGFVPFVHPALGGSLSPVVERRALADC